jgi:hypothetical protein
VAIGDKRRHNVLVVSSAVVSMIMSLALAPQQAGGPAPVGVVRPVFAGAAVRGPLPPDAADAVEAVRLELARLFVERGTRVVVPVAEVVTEQRKSRAIAALDERLTAATSSFKHRDYAEARSFAIEALQIFESSLAYSDEDDGWARYRELLLLVADAQLNARDPQACDETLGQLLVVEPDFQPKPGQLTTAMLARLEVVKDNQRATPRTMLEVKSRPPGAKVLVDGRRAGRAPVAVEVLPGIHYVTLDDNGKIHTERKVVGADGGRVTARLGAPEAPAAQTLLRQLHNPISKRDFTELSSDVADVTFSALIVPWGTSQQVLIARVRDGELDAVVGTRLPLKAGPRERALFQLVDAAMTRLTDGWTGDVADDPATLRAAFLQGAGDRDAVVVDEARGPNVPLLVGGIIGGVAVAAGVAVGAWVVVGAELRKDEGFIYAVDVSGL